MKSLRKLLLSITVGLPALATSTTLTSCSQTWGYLNPIGFGSVSRDNTNNPYYSFYHEGEAAKRYYDADGNWMPGYLQSNYIVDQAKSTPYAYTSPVSKWYQAEEDIGEGEYQKVLPVNQWQRFNDGWKTTTSSGVESSVDLKDQQWIEDVPSPKEDVDYRKTYTNSMNVNLMSNINFVNTIATTIQGYISSALQYQASQFKDEDDLNAAWGFGSKTIPTGSLNHGEKGTNANRAFYEYIFASSNAYSSGKAPAFLRPTTISFNFDQFPIPSYKKDSDTTRVLDHRDGISDETLKLLTGSTEPLYKQGVDTPAYWTEKREGKNISIPRIVKIDGEWKKTFFENGLRNEYSFTSVPILVHLNGISSTWVDPLKNDSFVPSDFFIKDTDDKTAKEIVTEAIGDNWSEMAPFIGETGKITPKFKTYSYNMPTENHKQVTVKTTSIDDVDHWDKRLVVDPTNQTIDGNTFVVLLTYYAYEYDDPAFQEKYKAELGEVPLDLQPDALKKLNVVSLGSDINIFPAYFLNVYDDMFAKANAEDKKVEGFNMGYILNQKVVNKHIKDLLNLLKRSGGDGFIPHAKDVSETGRNLLAMLAYMFGTNSEDIISTSNIMTPEEF